MNINPFARGWWLAALLWAALAPTVASAAVEPVGRVVSADGEVTVFRSGESARSLDRGDPVYEGDELRTGRRGNVQVRFVDDGLVALKPGSRFAVDRYRTDGDDAGGSVVMNFIRGALRTITGSIGGGPGQSYRMETPTATLGVRGTGYALEYCDAACAEGLGGEPGLHGRVDEGVVTVATPQGNAAFSAGDFFFAPQDGLPQPVLQPPKGILDRIQEQAAAREEADEIDEAAVVAAEEAGPSGPSGNGRRTSGESVFEAGRHFGKDLLGGGVAAAGRTTKGVNTYSNAQLFGLGGLGTNGSGDVIGAIFDAGLNSSGLTVALESGNLREVGFAPELGVGWGRWDGSFSVDGVSGFAGNLAFTVTNNFTAPARLAQMSGTLDYALAGGPKAFTPDSGMPWFVRAIQLGVNFDATSVSLNTFHLERSDMMAEVLFGAGDMALPSLDVANNALGFQMDNGKESGSVAGSFVGTNAEGMVMVYHVIDDDKAATAVTGTSVLQQVP